MMDQLGIKTLRPGASGDENNPRHANYDPAKANPYPDWPALMTLKNGATVTTPAQRQMRRAEIIANFDREVLGGVPADIPKMAWTVQDVDHERIGGKAATATKLIGHVAGATPAVNVALLDGQLAWRQHDGGHTDAPNMKWFIQWVDRNIGYKTP